MRYPLESQARGYITLKSQLKQLLVCGVKTQTLRVKTHSLNPKSFIHSHSTSTGVLETSGHRELSKLPLKTDLTPTTSWACGT